MDCWKIITLSTLPEPEMDLSMTLKIIEKLNDTDIEAHESLRLTTSLT